MHVELWDIDRVIPYIRNPRRAGVEPLQGGDWHPYQRKWVTERKHLPDVDAAAAGGWKTPRTLELCYRQPDAETMFSVVSEPRKLRAVKNSIN
jgi:hypothetical protein